MYITDHWIYSFFLYVTCFQMKCMRFCPSCLKISHSTVGSVSLLDVQNGRVHWSENYSWV